MAQSGGTQQCIHLEKAVATRAQHQQLHTCVPVSTHDISLSTLSDRLQRPTPLHTEPFTIIRRQMGFRTKAKNMSRNKSKKKKGDAEPTKNDELIKYLLKKTNNTADDIQVRILVDKGRDEQPDISVVTLTEAISISCDEGNDLIGLNLDQKPPVIKCVDYNRFMSDMRRKTKSKSANAGGGIKRTKQFSFKSGIDDHDLQRKVTNMVSYLEKGHASQVFLSSNRRNLVQDKNVITTTLSRIQEIVGDVGKMQGQLKLNEVGNRGSILFQPNSKRSKSN